MTERKIITTVIIVTWNNEAVIRDCLTSVLKQNCANIEIIVVDNYSSDNTSELIKKEFPQITLIVNKENSGFAKASNQAIRKSQGCYILLLNPDTIMFGGSLEKMISFMHNHQDAGACGCKIIDEAGKLMWSCFHFPSLITEICEITLLSRIFARDRFFGNYWMSYWDHSTNSQVEWLTGACLMVSREVVNKVGLLDEVFFMYTEDVDWCYRMKQQGYTVNYLANTQVVHKQGNSSNQAYSQMFAQRYRSRYLFFRKHYGLIRFVLLKIVVILSFIIRVACYLTGWIFIKDKVRAQKKISSYISVLRMSFTGLSKG